MHQMFSLRTATATIADGVNSAGVYQRIEIDNKAMRKQTDAETLVGVIELTESTNAVMEMHADVRVLDLLA